MLQFLKLTVRPYTQPEVFSLDYEEHEDAPQHLFWLAQYHRTIVVSLESRVRSRFPLASSLKEQEEEQYSIPLQTIQNLHESIANGKWWPNSILIKKCVSFTAVSIIFVHLLYT